MLKNITNEQEELNQLLAKLSSEGFTTEGIKGIYHGKKLALKKHYEKIKPYLQNSSPPPAQQRLQTPQDRPELGGL